MKLSPFHWVAIAVCDVLVRQVLFATSLVSGARLGPSLSLGHLTLLVIVNYTVARSRLSARTRAVIVLGAANTLFAAALVLLWAAWIRAWGTTACGFASCDWINGVITSNGVRTIAWETGIQIASNLLAVVLGLTLGRRCTIACGTKSA
jgi:hypothetical protein